MKKIENSWVPFPALVTIGHLRLEMAPSEKQNKFHFLNTSIDKKYTLVGSIYNVKI